MQSKRIPFLILALTAGLAACSPSGTVSRNVPHGVDARGDAIDGLLVGHRLMEAGEYELALKAYYRAAGTSGLNVDTLSAIGSANLALGRLGQAEDILRQAIDADPTFVPALNNLGVVLIERGEIGEARIIFQQAFAQDSGQTDAIRENLMLAIALSESSVYDAPQEEGEFRLVRREKGKYVLLTQL
ncbi:Tetratricopeptide repeat [Paracoccaceae bacterium]